MKKILNCRRSLIAILAIGSLLILGLVNNADVAGTIGFIVAAVAGANAGEKVLKKPQA